MTLDHLYRYKIYNLLAVLSTKCTGVLVGIQKVLYNEQENEVIETFVKKIYVKNECVFNYMNNSCALTVDN